MVAKNSSITSIQDNIELGRALRQHLGGYREDESAARKEKTELGIAAAICIICMAGVWFSFAKGMETLTSVEVPLEYMNRDSRMQIVSTSANSVRLYLSGSGTLLSSLKPDQIRVKLDMKEAQNGDNILGISNDSIVIPPGVRLNRIEPSEVKVVLDMPATKRLPIQVDWVGSLPDNLIMQTVVLEPKTAVVEGPSHILDQINTLYTKKISLDTINGSGQMTIPLSLAPLSLHMAGAASADILVRYKLVKRSEIKTEQSASVPPRSTGDGTD